MTSPAGPHTTQETKSIRLEDRLGEQDVTRAGAGSTTGALNLDRIDSEAQASAPLSPVSPISDHGDAVSRPATRQHDNTNPSNGIPIEKLPLNEAQKPAGWWSRTASDSWMLEFAAGVIGFAAIASIVGILWGYDGKPAPALVEGITVCAWNALRLLRS
jgi:hypothetical protein